MLTDEQKRMLEDDAARDMRRHWGDIKPNALAAAIDDIRARVVEEAWFGKPQMELSGELQKSVRFAELYGQQERTLEQARVAEHERDDALGR